MSSFSGRVLFPLSSQFVRLSNFPFPSPQLHKTSSPQLNNNNIQFYSSSLANIQNNNQPFMKLNKVGFNLIFISVQNYFNQSLFDVL